MKLGDFVNGVSTTIQFSPVSAARFNNPKIEKVAMFNVKTKISSQQISKMQ